VSAGLCSQPGPSGPVVTCEQRSIAIPFHQHHSALPRMRRRTPIRWRGVYVQPLVKVCKDCPCRPSAEAAQECVDCQATSSSVVAGKTSYSAGTYYIKVLVLRDNGRAGATSAARTRCVGIPHHVVETARSSVLSVCIAARLRHALGAALRFKLWDSFEFVTSWIAYSVSFDMRVWIVAQAGCANAATTAAPSPYHQSCKPGFVRVLCFLMVHVSAALCA
jgi:hypothetical protein